MLRTYPISFDALQFSVGPFNIFRVIYLLFKHKDGPIRAGVRLKYSEIHSVLRILEGIHVLLL
jgi:hypothetical protein